MRQKDGRQPDGSDPSLLHRIPSGNLVYADGCLAVTDRQTLSVFVPPAFDLDERERQARDHPDSAGALLALARAEADAERTNRALANAEWSERVALALPPNRGRHFVSEARRLRHGLLLKSARAAAKEKRWADSKAALKQAAGPEFAPAARLLALVRTATLLEEAGDFHGTVAAWQAILTADPMRGHQVYDGETPATAGAVAAARIAALKAKHGDAVYAPFEKQARALWDGAAASDRPALAARLAEAYPNAAVTRTARLEVGRRQEEAHGSGEAAPRLPALTFPLVRSWQVRLAPGEYALTPAPSTTGPAADSLWTVRPRGERAELVCRRASTGQGRWAYPLPFVPTWLAGHADAVVAAGPAGAACVGLEGGRLLWHFAAPVQDRHPTAMGGTVRVVLDPQPPQPLSEFRLGGGRFFLLQGERRLFALDAVSGQVLWHRRAPGSAFVLPPPQGRFFPRFYAGPECVLIQTGSGRRWRLDAASGRQLQD
ncbi:MAG TPA: PQQ-binding-like beta-propeller repeat protein, partial [Gemmataceae bacterium]|nr:PQQ-binding-like beta-propeller repeat protein [Gemmataceae bacterium]